MTDKITGLLRLVADVRFALGDDGKRMQDELIAYCAELRKDAERYRWLRKQPNDTSAPRIDVVLWTVEDESANAGEGLRLDILDAAIDAAIKASGEGPA